MDFSIIMMLWKRQFPASMMGCSVSNINFEAVGLLMGLADISMDDSGSRKEE